MCEKASKTACEFSKRRCARKNIRLYQRILEAYEPVDESDPWEGWDRLMRRIEIEWNLLSEKLAAATVTFMPDTDKEAKLA